MSEGSRSEVKGVWFVSARGYVLAEFGSEMLEAIIAQLLPEHREVMADPLPSSWYPEEALQDLLAVLHGTVAKGDDRRYVKLVTGASVHAANRFFRAILGLASTGFVMRKTPVFWNRLRRGAGRVEVESSPGRSLLQYRDFPYFADPNYRLMAEGSLRGLCEICGKGGFDVQIQEYGADWVDILVTY